MSNQPPAWCPELGTALDDRYALDALLGTGPTGAVYGSADMRLGESVAVKVLHPALFAEGPRAENLLRIQRARAFIHDHIARIRDVVIGEEVSYIITDRIGGPTLDKWLGKRGAPDAATLVRIMSQLVAGLEWIHQLGVNGNLKPKNVFLRGGDTVILSDPWFLRGVEAIPPGELAPRTDKWLAPEQAEAGWQEAKAADLHALGLILGMLLAGRPVLRGIPLIGQCPGVPSQIDDVYMKVTAPEPGARYPDLRSFWDAARPILEQLELPFAAAATATEDVTTHDVFAAAGVTPKEAKAMVEPAPEAEPAAAPRGVEDTTAEDAVKLAGLRDSELLGLADDLLATDAAEEPAARKADPLTRLRVPDSDGKETVQLPMIVGPDGIPIVADEPVAPPGRVNLHGDEWDDDPIEFGVPPGVPPEQEPNEAPEPAEAEPAEAPPKPFDGERTERSDAVELMAAVADYVARGDDPDLLEPEDDAAPPMPDADSGVVEIAESEVLEVGGDSVEVIEESAIDELGEDDFELLDAEEIEALDEDELGDQTLEVHPDEDVLDVFSGEGPGGFLTAPPLAAPPDLGEPAGMAPPPLEIPSGPPPLEADEVIDLGDSGVVEVEDSAIELGDSGLVEVEDSAIELTDSELVEAEDSAIELTDSELVEAEDTAFELTDSELVGLTETVNQQDFEAAESPAQAAKKNEDDETGEFRRELGLPEPIASDSLLEVVDGLILDVADGTSSPESALLDASDDSALTVTGAGDSMLDEYDDVSLGEEDLATRVPPKATPPSRGLVRKPRPEPETAPPAAGKKSALRRVGPTAKPLTTRGRGAVVAAQPTGGFKPVTVKKGRSPMVYVAVGLVALTIVLAIIIIGSLSGDSPAPSEGSAPPVVGLEPGKQPPKKVGPAVTPSLAEDAAPEATPDAGSTPSSPDVKIAAADAGRVPVAALPDPGRPVTVPSQDAGAPPPAEPDPGTAATPKEPDAGPAEPDAADEADEGEGEDEPPATKPISHTPIDPKKLKCPPGMSKVKKRKYVELADGSKVKDWHVFCIDRYEHPGPGRIPTTNIGLAGAKSACKAAGKRLCSRKEWRRGCGGLKYPYGKVFDPARCNVVGSNGMPKPLKPAGAMGRCRSFLGTFDMAGNAAEWTADGRVNGGSSYKDGATAGCYRSSRRMGGHPFVGFRCCARPRGK